VILVTTKGTKRAKFAKAIFVSFEFFATFVV